MHFFIDNYIRLFGNGSKDVSYNIYEYNLEFKKYFDDKVYKTVIPRNVRLSEAPSYGMPISLYDPRSKGAKAYEKFAKELLKNNAN